MSIRLPWLALGLAAAAAIVLVAVQLPPPQVHAVNRATALGSLNWAGLAEAPGARSVDAVSASWTVPAAYCRSGETSYSIAWAGIDGFGSSSVEQAGTESSCSNGSPVYDAWYELYPAPPVFLKNVPVAPGDLASVSIRFGHGRFAIHLSVAGRSFDTVQDAAGASRSSAEFIVEAPVAVGRVVDFAHFGPVTFTNLSVNGLPASTGDFRAIDMFTAAGRPLALTSVAPGSFNVRRVGA